MRSSVSMACREDEAWRQLRNAIDSLKSQMTKVRSEGVREAVERGVTSMSVLAKAKDVLHVKWRSKIKTAGHETADSKVAEIMEALETRVLSVLDQIQLKLAGQDKASSNLIAPAAPTRSPEQESIWTEVVKKSRGGQSKPIKKLKTAKTAKPNMVKKPAHSVKHTHIRLLAVLVSRKDEEFTELLRTLKRNVDPEATRNLRGCVGPGKMIS